MNGKRTIAYFSGIIVLAIAFFAYLEFVYLLGFPDGFISDLQRMQRNLAYLLIGGSVGFSFYFFWLGAIASRRRVDKQLLGAGVLYLLLVASFVLLNSYHRLRLAN